MYESCCLVTITGTQRHIQRNHTDLDKQDRTTTYNKQPQPQPQPQPQQQRQQINKQHKQHKKNFRLGEKSRGKQETTTSS